MFYYFDESGDWNDLESKEKKVIGGLIISSNSDYKKIYDIISNFKAKFGLTSLHASELRKHPDSNIFNELISIIASFFEQNLIRSFINIIYPQAIRKIYSRINDIESVYIDFASSLISEMILGDTNRSLFYDPKFHNTFVDNIVKYISKDFSNDIVKRLYNNYELSENKIESKKNILLDTRFNKLKSPESSVLKRKIEQASHNELKNLIKEFDFTELDLYINENIKLRERFKTTIQNNLRNMANLYNIIDNFDVKIDFVSKQRVNILEKAIGIEIIDTLCNLFYSDYKKNNLSNSKIIIFNNTHVQEIKDEI